MPPRILRCPVSLCRLGLAVGLALGGARGVEAAGRRAEVTWSFADVAAGVLPATVAISGERGAPVAMGLDELRASLDLPRAGDGPTVASSTGSGVIVRPDGLVLTNHHVVASTTSLTVTLYDGRELPARLLASDPRTDVAVLQIVGAGPFATAPIGDSDRVRVGDPVLTVGHPYEFAFTVTTGIVSARGRRNLDQDEIQDYLQTDAAVNPGVSGGPLFDAKGAVVGLTTAVYAPAPSEGPGATGLSFAIPSELAWRVAQDLLLLGRARRPHVGVVPVDAPGGGAGISRVEPGSPAERAGLRAQDVILSVGGDPVEDAADLSAVVGARAVGEVLDLRLRRGADELGVALTLGERVDAPPPALADTPRASWRGATLVASSGEGGQAGARVVAVKRGTPAFISGLIPGDVIQKIGETGVQDISAFGDADKWPEVLVLQVWRGTGAVFLVAAGRK